MTTKIRDHAKHSYFPGFSKVSELAADERIARERLQPKLVVAKLRTYDELLAEIDELLAEIDALRSQSTLSPAPRRKSSGFGKSRGRTAAESVIMKKGVTYYSMAHIAKLAGIDQSNVSRQVAKLGIKPEHIGGINYIPASQVSNIKRRKR